MDDGSAQNRAMENSPMFWVLATHAMGLEEALSSWLQLGPGLNLLAIWGSVPAFGIYFSVLVSHTCIHTISV